MSESSPEPSLTNLPDEVYLQILRHLNFEDWVALTQVNRKLRQVLDAPMFSHFMYHLSFGNYMKSYCHYPNACSKSITHKVYGLIKNMERPIDCSNDSSLMKLLMHPDAYFAIIDNFEQLFVELQLQMKTFITSKSIALSTYVFLKRILDLHNFVIANRYFELNGDRLSEEAFFQLSRYSSNFFHHAAYRLSVLHQINNALDQSGLPQRTKRLNFSDMRAYEHFLKNLSSIVLRHLPADSTDKPWSTITAFYSGRPCGDQNGLQKVYTLHVLVKFLKERVFDRYKLYVGEQLLNSEPVVKNDLIIIGRYAIFVNNRKLKLVNSSLLHNFGILRNGAILESIFSELLFDGPIRIQGVGPTIDWNALPYNTITVDKIRSLCFLHQMDIEEFGNLQGREPFQKVGSDDVPMIFKRGQIVTSDFQDLIGIVIEDTVFDSPVIDVQGINSGDIKQFKIGDFRQIGPGDVSVNDEILQSFLTWLILSDLFTQFVGTSFTHLVLEDGYFRLIFKDLEKRSVAS